MAFNSLQFMFFLPILVAGYYLTPPRYRWLLLLTASYLFYMSWKAEYVVLLFFSTLINYLVGLRMGSIAQDKRKKYLVLALIFNVGLLFGFKYVSFFNETIRQVLQHLNIFYAAPEIRLLIPVGISFYTFQTISYLIEVYRGSQEPEHHFGYFALFVSFFPQIISGPIARPSQLIPQLKSQPSFSYERMASGLQLMALGYFKKLVIADRLAMYVNAVYDNPVHHSGPTLVVATVFFAFQLYADFSGYTDIAMGTARILGYELIQNFRRPFFSRSIQEFWNRWHISLSTWLRDYLYTPLSLTFREWGTRGIIASIILTFTLAGLWHGARFTFVLFGLVHGIGLSFDALTAKSRKKLAKRVPAGVFNVTSMLLTFAYVCFAFIFFRANTVGDAFLITRKILTVNEPASFYIGDISVLLFSLAGIAALLFIEVRREYNLKMLPLFASRYIVVRYFCYAWVIVLILLLGVLDEGQFIYFQF